MSACEGDYDDGPCCPDCGNDLEYEDCAECGGEGYFDDYDFDPIEHWPGETSPCHICNGEGGWWFCPNRQCPRGVVEVKASRDCG